jgi:hypothetical protein
LPGGAASGQVAGFQGDQQQKRRHTKKNHRVARIDSIEHGSQLINMRCSAG